MSEIRLNENKITLTTASSDPFIKYEHWLSRPILRFGYLGENELPKEYYINEKKRRLY